MPVANKLAVKYGALIATIPLVLPWLVMPMLAACDALLTTRSLPGVRMVHAWCVLVGPARRCALAGHVFAGDTLMWCWQGMMVPCCHAPAGTALAGDASAGLPAMHCWSRARCRACARYVRDAPQLPLIAPMLAAWVLALAWAHPR